MKKNRRLVLFEMITGTIALGGLFTFALSYFKHEAKTNTLNQAQNLIANDFQTNPTSPYTHDAPDKFYLNNSDAIRLDSSIDLLEDYQVVSGQLEYFGVASISGTKYLACFELNGNIRWKVAVEHVNRMYYVDHEVPYLVALIKNTTDATLTIASYNMEGTVIDQASLALANDTVDEYKSWDLFKATGGFDCFSVMKRTYGVIESERISSALNYKFNDDGTLSSTTSLGIEYNTLSEEYYVISFQPVISDVHKTYIMLYASGGNGEDKRIFLKIWADSASAIVIDLNVTIPEYRLNSNQDLLTGDASNCQIIPSEVYLDNYQKELVRFNGIVPSERGLIFRCVYSYREGRIIEQDIISFNNSTIDIDLSKNTYIAENKYFTRPSYASFGSTSYLNSLMVLDPNVVERKDFTKANFTYNGTNKVDNAINFYNLVQSYVPNSKTSTPISGFKDRLYMFHDNSAWLINTKNNNYAGSWDYETALVNEEYTIPNVNTFKSSEYATPEKLKSIVNLDMLKELIYQFDDTSNYTFTDINTSDSNLYYAGKIMTKVEIDKGYVNHVKSRYKSSYITFSGFYQWETRGKVSSFAVGDAFGNLAATEVKEEQVIDFLFAHKDEIFDDLPFDIKRSNFLIKGVHDDNAAHTKSFTIMLTKYVNQAHELTTNGKKEIQLELTGFHDLTTAVVDTIIEVPADMKGEHNKSDAITDDWIRSQLESRKAKIFRNLPENYAFNNTNVVIGKRETSTVGELDVMVTLKNVLGPEIREKFHFTGFRSVGLTTTLSTTKEYSLDYTIVGKFLASDMEKNKEATKTAILKAINNTNNLSGLPTGVTHDSITVEDIDFSLVPGSVDNVYGKAKVTITLKNGKAWVDGNVLQSYNFNNSEFIVTNFKTQEPTKQIKFELGITSPSMLELMASDLTKIQAKKFIDENLRLIFNEATLPTNAESKIIKLEDSNTTGTCDVLFVLTEYFDDKGISTNINSKTYTVKLKGFLTSLTSLVSNEVRLIDAGQVFSVDAEIVNASYLIEKLDAVSKQLFANIPIGYKFVGNTTIDSIRTTWNDPTVPFGSVKFNATLQNVYTINGTAPQTFRDITFSGFKSSEATTKLVDPNRILEGGKMIKNVSPSDVTADNIDKYNSALKESVMYADSLSPIFKFLQPHQVFSRNAFELSNPRNPDNNKGQLTLTLTLNNQCCWEDGIKTQKDFDIVISGFNIRADTQWGNKDVYGIGLNAIYAERWTEKDALTYVRNQYEQFFTNVPTSFNPETDIIVDIIGFEKIDGVVVLEVGLLKYFNEQGNEIVATPDTAYKKIFNIKGFKKINPNPTTPKSYGLSENRQQFWPYDPFTADILDDKPLYADMVKNWLTNNRSNISHVLENYDLNETIATVDSVSISKNYNTTGVIVNVTFNDVSLGSGDVGRRTFPYVVTAKPTPQLNINSREYPGLGQEELEKLSNSFSGLDKAEATRAFTDELANRVYDAMLSELSRIAFPEVVKRIIYDKVTMLKNIASSISVEYEIRSKRITAATFNPTALSNNLFKEYGGVNISNLNFRTAETTSDKQENYSILIYSSLIAAATGIVIILIFALIRKQKILQRSGGSFEGMEPYKF